MPLPGADPTADVVARQVYFANHLYAFDNFSIEGRGSNSAVLINRGSDGQVSVTAVERHLNHAYTEGEIKSRELAVLRTGDEAGAGMLVTEYRDSSRGRSYMALLPGSGKVRRFPEPKHDQAWGGSVFSFGDVSLRQLDDETHELIGKKPFRTCLGVIESIEGKDFRLAGELPKRSCRHVNKEVYGLKSTTKFGNWWYDYRISMVDTKTFADYRTLYYKNGKLVKIIDRDWGVVDGANSDDPRALFWKSWYGVDLVTGQESWAIVPQSVIAFNIDRPDRFWSEATLRRITQ